MESSVQPTKPKKKKNGIQGLLISLCIGLVLMCFLLTVVSAVFVFTDFDETHEKTAAVLIVVLSAFCVGSFCAKNASSRGFFWGLLGGCLFGVLLWLLGLLLVTEGTGDFSWRTVLTTSGAGLLGGIVGINLKKK
ncbi:MAG: TIGR04086 family membrane protein [Clostridia bacterium]|nr:TIGR04086 family membrane protein [Clostridia bacterium]